MNTEYKPSPVVYIIFAGGDSNNVIIDDRDRAIALANECIEFKYENVYIEIWENAFYVGRIEPTIKVITEVVWA